MRSKYVVSLHILEIAISILQSLMGPFFPKFINTPYIFSPYAPNAAHLTIVIGEIMTAFIRNLK